MVVPKNITLDWLLRKDKRGNPHAHRLALDNALSLIPENLLAEALSITSEWDQRTTLFWALSSRECALQVPTSFFSYDVLTRRSRSGGDSPLQQAAAAGALDLIPWEKFSARQWLPELGYLKKIAPMGDSEESLNRFIRTIEAFEKMKAEVAVSPSGNN